jgi:hypothetical protein
LESAEWKVQSTFQLKKVYATVAHLRNSSDFVILLRMESLRENVSQGNTVFFK